MTKQILLIDDDYRRRATISHCLESDDTHIEPFESVAELPAALPGDGVVLAHDQERAIPDIVAHMAAAGIWLPIICFSEHTDVRKIVGALQDGANDYLLWPFCSADISIALEAAMSRFASASGARLREVKALSRIGRLTPREKDVLAGVVDGLPNRLIGERLSISPRTLEIHRANMLGKLGASHTSEAIRIAIEAALPL